MPIVVVRYSDACQFPTTLILPLRVVNVVFLRFQEAEGTLDDEKDDRGKGDHGGKEEYHADELKPLSYPPNVVDITQTLGVAAGGLRCRGRVSGKGGGNTFAESVYTHILSLTLQVQHFAMHKPSPQTTNTMNTTKQIDPAPRR